MDMEAHNTTPAAQHLPPSRSNVLRQALRDQSRVAYHGAILTAAETIILREGFKRTKMLDVAEATGVSVGTLYNYFESKEAVLQAIMEHHYSRLEDQLKLQFESADPVEQVIELVARVYRFIEDNRELFQLYCRSELDGHDGSKTSASLSPNAVFERVGQPIAELLNQCLQSGRIRADIPLRELVWSLRTLLQALLTDWYRDSDRFSLTQRGAQLVALFFRGAGQ